jgi:hypothetical protein
VVADSSLLEEGAQTSLGKAKWAAWSPCRWPISRPPTLNANSPRRPGPAATPGQEVTCSVIRSLTRCRVDMTVSSRPSDYPRSQDTS